NWTLFKIFADVFNLHLQFAHKKRRFRYGFLMLFILLTALAVPVWGRAGGGGSSGGGGGSGRGGGYSGGSGGNSYHSGRSSSCSNLVGNIVFGANAVLITCGGAIVFTVKSKKAAMKSKNLMRQYEKIG
ncbi:MAG: hypothetical protein LUG26_09740, partial [Ruminococcus sp.]|nr:hypothetical protein [Ruminococcus sp.]